MLTSENMAHLALADAEHGGDTPLWHPAVGEAADLFRLFVGQLRVGRKGTMNWGSAPLGYAIANVISMRAQEEMLGIHAVRVVAAMAYEEAIWDGAMEQLIGESMGHDVSLLVPETPIAVSVMPPAPFPTTVCGDGSPGKNVLFGPFAPSHVVFDVVIGGGVTN